MNDRRSDDENKNDENNNNISVSRTIGAPAARLYGMVSDLVRMGEWSPEATGGRWVGGATGPAVGSRFRGTNANGRRRWATTAIVEQAEPSSAFVFRVVIGPIQVARWGYRFQPAAEGDTAATVVTESWEDLRGRFARVAGSLVSGVSDRDAFARTSMETTLARLAAAAEQPPGSVDRGEVRG
ncbi:MAG TPA: SRPBCC family protein [Ilumatobacter sp.]|nr:SRPBCC family protein [Ilumatobacter sp.]